MTGEGERGQRKRMRRRGGRKIRTGERENKKGWAEGKRGKKGKVKLKR